MTLATDDGRVPLKADPELWLIFTQQYRVVHVPDDTERGPYDVSIAGYEYALDDHEGHEVIAYHWHPEGLGPIKMPHLHLGHGARIGRSDLIGAHMPTGRVSFEEFIWLILDQFHVRHARDDWQAVLEETHRNYERWRT
ncbi:MAG: hypothetical protein IT305_28905 [Chloroflexi bacterium]|nr:hypothetical protein [Chloroflexota bacterium]